MTIAAAYLTSEGVVLGADSTTTVSRGGAVVQLLNHAQKVFEIGHPGRMALCTWGSGIIATTSHRTIAARLSDYVAANNATVIQAADELVRMVTTEFAPPAQFQRVGYFIGGRNPDRTIRCFSLWFEALATVVRTEMKPGECHFAGNPEFFSRVVDGYAPRLKDSLRTAVIAKVPGLPAEFASKFDEAFAEVTASLATVGFQDVPIREAIDYVHAFLHITIKAFKFRIGAPICGGPIEVGFVTSDRDFRWAVHKSFGTAVAEQKGAL